MQSSVLPLAIPLAMILTACSARVRPSQEPRAGDTLLPAEAPPQDAPRIFHTDFSRHTVRYAEILSGGPEKDGIPAIDTPRFVSTVEADGWLRPNEPVIRLRIGDDARAYPIRIIIWHELVNDVVGGRPVLVSYCPLCNTAIAFSRVIDGEATTFGTTGYLRYSNLIMYDRVSESWWQQASGECIAGRYAATRLDPIPASILPWRSFRDAHPSGRVLSNRTGFPRDYGANPYAGYDDVAREPLLYRGPALPTALPAMEHVLGLSIDGKSIAYPYRLLARERVVNDTVGGRPVVIFWAPGMVSGLKEPAVADGDDVGSAAAFSPIVEGRLLHFRIDGERIVDDADGSVWSPAGRRMSGPGAGEELRELHAVSQFWFSWFAFNPGTRVYSGR